MRLEELDYELPRELIAEEPVEERERCRLMVVDRGAGTIQHRRFYELPQLLRAGDVVVLNDTRVIPARVSGRRLDTGGRWQGLFVREEAPGQWIVMLQTRGKLLPGVQLLFEPADHCVLELQGPTSEGYWKAWVRPADPALAVLERVGQVPLPPYVGREPRPEDQAWYQTVYARKPGSVAAPTAGLHFTEALLRELVAKGMSIAWVTLHVGPGTFRPIKAGHVEEHRMEPEWCEVTPETVELLQQRRRDGGRIVAVGTTVVRTLETASSHGQLAPYRGESHLYIVPPFTFRAVDALVTNFHLPKTTLLALVYAFGGKDLIRRAYEEAVRQRYRFYSYGDAMLIV
jgi:S-adenosylmethionine:tRNA ribosyltransferase-isomerase